jgi:hypothetical protein
MTRTRAGALTALACLAAASPAAAHGIGSRGDLPISKGLFIWGAVLAVAVSFAAVSMLWVEPRMPRMASGRPLPAWTGTTANVVSPVLRLVGLAFFALTLVAAWSGSTDSFQNFAPVSVYVWFWVGVLWLSAVVGGIWRSLNPWDTLAAIGSLSFGPTPAPYPPDRSLVWSHWPAAIGIFAFVWLELAYFEPASPRVLAYAITAYSVAVLVMAVRYGRRWLQTGEAFTVLFGLVACIAPIGRRDDGRLTLRPPFTGLTVLQPRRGTVAVVLVVLGSTTFDGVSRTPWWGSIVRLKAGWERTAYNTLALVMVIAAVAVVFLVAARLVAVLGRTDPRVAPARYIHSLVPIALAYSVAHYFSLFVFEGQNGWRLLSDPLGRGWDLFGTADHTIDFLVLSTGAIAATQTIAIIIGHVAGVVLAHERALEDVGEQRAAVSQLPMLAAMVAFTVIGLTLLLEV